MTVSLREYSRTIPVGGSTEIVRPSNHLSCTKANQRFKVSFDNGPSTDFFQGVGATLEPFTKLTITNTGNAPLFVDMMLSMGDVQDSRLNVSGSVVTTPALGDTCNHAIAAPAANVVAPLVAANPNRTSIVCRMVSGQGRIVTTANPASTHGIPLAQGETYTIEATTALWVATAVGCEVRADEWERSA